MAFAPIAVDDVKTTGFIRIGEPQDIDFGDGELLECLRAGEEKCFETLVRNVGPQVLATAKRYLRSDVRRPPTVFRILFWLCSRASTGSSNDLRCEHGFGASPSINA